MKKIYALFLSAISFNAFSQQEFSSFCNTGHGGATTFATDYQATGINPSNLGWLPKYPDKKVTMGFMEFTGSVYSDSLRKDNLRNSIVGLITGNNSTLTYSQKIQAVSNFTQSGFTMNADMGSFGIALNTRLAGGFAFRINDHFQWYSKLGSQASNLIFLGNTSSLFDHLVINVGTGSSATTQTITNHPNLSPDTAAMVIKGTSNAPLMLSKILEGSRMTLTWYRDYNLSYGRKIVGNDSVFAVYGGIGIKYIQGMAMLDIKSEKDANGNDHLTGFSSLSPAFGVNYGAAQAQANQVLGSGFPPKSVGSGFGFDFGASMIIKGKLKIGTSIINIGSINWTGNVYQLKDTLMVSLSASGVQNFNLFSQLKNMLGPNGMFKVTGQQTYQTQLPGMVRAGASMLLGKKAEVGVDFIIPTNSTIPGSYTNPIIGLGGDFMPVKWLKLQGGFITGGNYPFQIPMGIIFVGNGGAYEAGIASRDAITFFTQKGPTISLSTGFIRMRF
ncbi:MAG TPA: DUF5723 family protein [Bacteroidia bacterium]|nr:DUF5723 family protein [Bacteroidia bacterium]